MGNNCNDCQGSNHQTIRADNKALILRILYRDSPLSRTDLAARTGLSKMTITNQVQELLQQKTIKELPPKKAKKKKDVDGLKSSVPIGRKPVLLGIVPNAYHALGIYIARDHIVVSVFNWSMVMKASYTLSFPETDNPVQFHERMSLCIQKTLEISKISTKELTGIGAAVIGPVNLKSGIIQNPPNFHNLRDLPIKAWLVEDYGLPVFIDNDMNAAALAEHLFGHGKELSNFVYIGVSNGIGAGLIVNGQLFEGTRGYAGEIGHISIVADGPKCACGNNGCLELYVSLSSTIKQVQEEITNGRKSVLTEADTDITWPTIVQAAKTGDILSLEYTKKVCHYLSIGIVNVINMFDPCAIFLGHKLALADEWIVDLIREEVKSHVMICNHKGLVIRFSTFGERAPIVGSVALVFRQFFV